MYLASQSSRRLISQILSYPNSLVQDEAVEGRVRAEQINNVKRYLTWILLANICNALVLVAALWSSPLRRLAVAWASAIAVVGLFEFAIVVVDVADAAIVTALAARIVSSLDRPFLIDGRQIYTGACVGIALAPADGDNPEFLLKNADEALNDPNIDSVG
jgi:Diguanylate cyclase, GGDEF domain